MMKSLVATVLLLLLPKSVDAWLLLRSKPRLQQRSSPVSQTAAAAGTATAVIGGAGAAALTPARFWTNRNQRDASSGKKSQQKQQFQLYSSNNNNYTPAANSMVGNTVVITGATAGLGLESAKRLAVAGANLILTARTDRKGRAAVEAVHAHLREQQQQQVGGSSSSSAPSFLYEKQSISYKLLDLDDLSTVKQVVNNWDDVERIDVLLNNAGIMALPERELTVDGFERQMQSNHLGHFALTSLLSPKFSDTARIITVSSEAHKAASNGLLFDYKYESGYSAWKAYGQSKLANIYFTRELQRRIDATPGLQWTAATLHPGVVATDLGRYMMGEESHDKFKRGNGGFLQTFVMKVAASFLKTPAEGATTQIWLASGGAPPGGGDVRGKYFSDCKARVLDDFATDSAAALRLWKESEELTGVAFPLGTVATAAAQAEKAQV